MQRKKDSRVRGNNFSKEEELNLVQKISEYKHILENKNSNQITSGQKDEAWQLVLQEFNSSNSPRTLTQIKSKYDNLKTAARKYIANANRNLYATGGGPAQSSDSKSIIYDEVLNVLNKKTADGLYNKHDDDVIIEEIPYDKMEEQNINLITENIVIVSDEGKNKDQENVMPGTSDTSDTNDSRHVWESYTPKMLKTPKHKKLILKNKPAPEQQQLKTLFALKQQYIEQKIQNLKNEDRRKQEKHDKELEQLNVEITKKKKDRINCNKEKFSYSENIFAESIVLRLFPDSENNLRTIHSGNIFRKS